MTYKLDSLTGKSILFRFSSGTPISGRIVDVESAGVWIQSEELSRDIQGGAGVNQLLPEPIFFVPFSSLRWMMASEDYFQH